MSVHELDPRGRGCERAARTGLVWTMSVSLGMPAAAPARRRPPAGEPEDQGRQGRGRRRRSGQRAVDAHDPHDRHQRDAPADRRAHGIRLRHRAGGLPEPGRRRGAAGHRPQVADPGDRRHPLPAQVRLRGDRRRLRGRAGQPGQHPPVRRPGREIARRAKDAGVSIRIGVNAGSLDKRILEKYGKPTAEALVESAVWEASLFEEHDFHDFKISVKHNDPVVMIRPTSCSPSGATGRCTSASPRPARRSRAPSSRPPPSARCCPGHRRHDPGLAVGPAGRGGQGRHPDPAVAQPAPPQARDRLVPLVRSRPGRRLQARRRGHRGPRGHDRAAARGRHGLRRQRPGRGPRGRPRGRRPATARARSSCGARSSRPCPRT